VPNGEDRSITGPGCLMPDKGGKQCAWQSNQTSKPTHRNFIHQVFCLFPLFALFFYSLFVCLSHSTSRTIVFLLIDDEDIIGSLEISNSKKMGIRGTKSKPR